MRSKQLAKGLKQLAEEGAIQVFRPLTDSSHILGAVGVLQFDVIIARLKAEYGVTAVYEPSPISCPEPFLAYPLIITILPPYC